SQGDLVKAKEYWERALAIREKLALGSVDMANSAHTLAHLDDERGDPRAAIEHFRQALHLYDERAPESLDLPHILQELARLLVESGVPGAAAEAKRHLERAAAIQDRVRSLPRDARHEGAPPQEEPKAIPQIRFLTPEENSEVKGDQVEVRVAFLAPVPLARYRVWINGRPFGGKTGFDLPLPANPQHSTLNAQLPKGR